MFRLRFIRKGLSLRIVNLVGLTVTVVSLVLSICYIRHERSYDRHHSKVERIVRLSPRMEGEPLDVRSFGNSVVPLLEALPEVETYAKIHNYYSTDLKYILIAFAVAAPLAYWLLDRWLQTFAYRIAIDWWMFASPP